MSPSYSFSTEIINKAFPWLSNPQSELLTLLKIFLSPMLPTIATGCVTLVILAIFISITFGRIRRSNGIHPDTNRIVGSVCYLIFHSAALYICWKIWGLDMFDESIFYMMQIDAFMLVRIFLMAIGFWVY